jgi:hypothetical protein
MRRIFELSVLCFAAGAVSACKPDDTISNTAPPTAGVRFINAVPDTSGGGGLDLRFVDLVENSDAFGVTFRDNPLTANGVTASSLIQFKAARAGSRHFRIFLDDTIQTTAMTVLEDSTANLEAGHNYTFLLWGNARAGKGAPPAMSLNVIDENVPDPGSNIALRVINTTGSAIDVSAYTQGGTVPASPTWKSVAPYSVSAYTTVPPNKIMFHVTGAGSSTALFSDALAIVGEPVGTSTNGCTVGVDCDVTPGTTVPGSAISLIVFPASVTGAKTPQTSAFKVPASSFMWDRRPPRSCTVSFGC